MKTHCRKIIDPTADGCVAWSVAESVDLETFITSYGNRWEQIAAELNRSPSSCRNRWQRIQKGRQDLMKGNFKQRCRFCGAPRRGHVCFIGELALKPILNTVYSRPLPPSPISKFRPSTPSTVSSPPTHIQASPQLPSSCHGVGAWQEELELKMLLTTGITAPFFWNRV